MQKATTPGRLKLASRNLLLALRGRPTRLVPDGDILVARHPGGDVHFCRFARYNRYKHGRARLVAKLAAEYHLDRIEERGGTFIDCGANVGELGFWARGNGHDYIAFEPEALEAKCCDLNNFEGRAETRRIALWYEQATLRFNSKPDTADSSLFDVNDADGSIEVAAERLDSVLDAADLKGPVILKLEAEGAEPEVLQGATALLPAIDYVAVDCGYERGAQNAHTFVEVNDLLSASGFKPVAANFKRVTMLYRRERAAG